MQCIALSALREVHWVKCVRRVPVALEWQFGCLLFNISALVAHPAARRNGCFVD
jgi:hypothetical protein